jgi:hypothetical protein
MTVKSLLHPSIWPNHDGNHIAVGAGLVEQFPARFHSALFVGGAFGVDRPQLRHLLQRR